MMCPVLPHDNMLLWVKAFGVHAADALLSYEGLAKMEAFWGNTDRARGLFQEGHLQHTGTSRF